MAPGVDRVLILWLLRRQEPLLLILCGIGIAALVLLPLSLPCALLAGTARETRGEGLAALGNVSLWLLLGRTLLLSAAVTAAALCIGIPMGILTGRVGLHGRSVALLVHCFPLFLPPLLPALGWFHLLGSGGGWASSLFFGHPGLVAVLALAFSPIVTLLTALALQSVDPSLEQAARVVARPWQVLTRVSLPLIWPSMALAALLVFTLSLSEVAVPMFLRVKVYGAAVFTRLGGIDFAPGEAFALVVPLIGVGIALLAVERALRRFHAFASFGLRSRDSTQLELGRWQPVAAAGLWTVALLSAAPMAGLAVKALEGGGFLVMHEWLANGVRNSLVPAFLAATLTAAMALPIGWAVARHRRGAAWLDGSAALGLFVPAAVLGVGLIQLWNRPATQFIYRGTAILVLGYLAHYGILGFRVMAAAVSQSSSNLEDAAAAAGAGCLWRLWRIVLPLHARGLMATWLLTALFCLRDLEMAILFYPPGLEPLPVRIFTLEANGPEPVVAALALAHAGITGLVLAPAALFALRRAS